MGIPHEHVVQDDVRGFLHTLPLDFGRHRLLGPRQVVAVLLTMIREQCGYERGLALVHEHHGEDFGWTGNHGTGRTGPPSAGAFCRARQNLTLAEMMEMFQAACDSPTATAARNRWIWREHRVLAADGVRMLLPATKPIIDEYGRPKLAKGEAYQPQLLQVTLWDVGAVQPVSWINLPCHGKGYGERSGILHLLDKMKPGDVLLLDRGFPSRRLLHELIARGIHFVIRMTTSGKSDFAEVTRFLASGSKDAKADFSYDDPDVDDPLIERLRLVRATDPDGTPRVLVTSLRDRKRYPRQDLFELYQRRWGIENAFRDIKIRYETENFHGTTPQFINQEIIAVMLLMLIESMVEETAIMSLPMEARPTGDQLRPLRHNRAALGDRLPTLIAIGLSKGTVRSLQRQFTRGLAAIITRRRRVRRPRSCPRVCKSQYGRWRFENRTKSHGFCRAA